MLAQDYLRIKREINDSGILFSFSGYISEGILFALGDALKKKLSHDETDSNTVRRVFSVFVEQAQNIIRYSAEKFSDHAEAGPRISSGMITVGCEGGKFFVACGNIMLREDVYLLKEKLELLRGMDPAGIKAYYLEKLKEPSDAASMGANIGLIEIARRSSEPIQFDFTDAGDKNAFYCLKAFI